MQLVVIRLYIRGAAQIGARIDSAKRERIHTWCYCIMESDKPFWLHAAHSSRTTLVLATLVLATSHRPTFCVGLGTRLVPRRAERGYQECIYLQELTSRAKMASRAFARVCYPCRRFCLPVLSLTRSPGGRHLEWSSAFFEPMFDMCERGVWFVGLVSWTCIGLHVKLFHKS